MPERVPEAELVDEIAAAERSTISGELLTSEFSTAVLDLNE